MTQTMASPHDAVRRLGAVQSTTAPPIDTATVPGITDFMDRLQLGSFVGHDLTSPPGRNAVWIGTTDAGHEVFIKHLMGFETDVDQRLSRLVDFQRFVDLHFVDRRVPAPVLLDHDPDTKLVAFEAIREATGGAQLVVDEEFTSEHARRVGAALASIHDIPTDLDIDDSSITFPTTDVLDALPEPMFDALSFGEVQAWNLLQHDSDLWGAIARLRTAERFAPKVPIHGDFRIDQLLFTADDIYITDWEEFRLADGARDVGAFAGEWLYRSVLDILTTRGGQIPVDVLSHDEVLQRGSESLRRLVPCVRSFWDAYRQVRREIDDQFTERATAFAGWHTIDRLLAGGSRRNRLTGIERAAAGIGRSALVAPERYAATIGLEDQ